MVQRKLPTKLTLQSDHAKAQSFLHHHDLKSPRGADLKAKKMKKSGSIKRPKHPPPPSTSTSTPPLCKSKTTPNYMKSTTSSDARKEQLRKSGVSSSLGKRGARALTKNPSFKPARAAAAARKCNPVVVATCSSTLKDCKFPAFLSLNPEGTSTVKVCPYTYCSLNGHHHPPLPPLKTFMSARRRAVKTQRRAPAVEDDDINKRSITPEESNDFFLEIYAAGLMDETAAGDQEEKNFDDASSEQNQEVFAEEERKEESSDLAPNIVNFYEQDSDGDGSDMEWEIGYGSPLQFDYDYGSSDEKHVEPDLEEDAVNFKEFCFDEVLMDEEASQESLDEDGFSSDAFSSSDDGDSTCLYDGMQNSSTLKVSMEEEEEEDDEEKKNILFEYKSPITDSQINNQEEYEEASSFDDLNLPNNGAVAEKEDTALLRFAGSSKRPVKDDDDELGAFNPRGPNFLSLEADPEAEKVDLRHQDLEERKNSEEWMVDYALRQVLGPARKRKVAMLVEAFEKVTPQEPNSAMLQHLISQDKCRPAADHSFDFRLQPQAHVMSLVVWFVSVFSLCF